MNLSQLRDIRDGQDAVFVNPFPAFTVGKKYRVTQTGTGRMVYDDTGMGRYLCGIEDRFESENKEAPHG